MNKLIVTTCLAVLPLAYAAAEGYQVNAQSTKQAGMAHVGAAMKLGAESMHFNPAGLVFMDKTVDLSVGITGVFAHAKYSNGGYEAKNNVSPNTPIYSYAGFKIYDNLAAGIAFNTPYGSSIEWDDNWKGSHLIQEISLKAFNIQPTISWKICDKLSIGAGLMMEFGNIKLNRALIGPGEMTYMANYMLQSLSQILPSEQVGAITPMVEPLLEEMSRYDDAAPASVALRGDAGIRFGFNVGAMYDINEKFTIGLSYRSKVTAKVDDGSIDLRYANEEHFTQLVGQINTLLEQFGPALGITNGISIPALNTGTFASELPLPDNWNVGITYHPTKDWTVSGEVQFVGWGAYKQLAIHFSPSSLSSYDMTADKLYQNTRIYRLGAQYAATNRLDVRLGVYLDESPVKDDYLNPETPSMDKLGITAGLSFRPLDKLSVDFAFTYLTGFGRDGSYTDEYMLMKTIPNVSEQYSKRTFTGHYDAHAFMPSIGVSYSF